MITLCCFMLTVFLFVVALLLQEIAKCNTSAQKLMLSLVLRSSNWDEIIAKKQSRAVQKLAKFFNIPKVGLAQQSLCGLIGLMCGWCDSD